jgi:competence ComEA-like helix-hairpin-helix protein
MSGQTKAVALIFTILFAVPFLVLAEQININSATLKELDLLTGIGPVYAERIINDRPYSSIDDLSKVKGIGPSTIQKIKAQGWACVDCETSLPSPKTEQPNLTQAASSSSFDTPLTATNEKAQNNLSLQTILLAGFLALCSGAAVLSIKKLL